MNQDLNQFLLTVESISPDNSNEINIQPFVNLLKKEITDHVNNEIERFQQEIKQTYNEVLTKSFKAEKYE